MADPNFVNSGNFVNPQYATPEQLANQRAYAEALMKRSDETVNRPAGALANMINMLTGTLERNRANELQSQAAEGNASNLAAIIRQLQQGKTPDAGTLGRIQANPLGNPDQRSLVDALVRPKPMEDVAGRPAYGSPSQGVKSAPYDRGFEPGIRPGLSTPDASISQVPQAAPPLRAPTPLPPPPAGGVRLDPQAMNDWRRANPIPTPQAGSGGGGQVPGAVLPTAPAPAAVPNGPMTLEQLAEFGRKQAAMRTFTQGTAEAQTNLAKGDFDAAATAPAIQRVAGVMLDNLRSSKNLEMGPTAEAKTRFKKILANELPGLLSKDQIEGIASQDSFEKSAAQLSGLITRGASGTDAQLLNNIRSVPGAHNSKQGAEALLLMTMDVAKQQQALRQATAGAKTAQDYEAQRAAFFANPQNRIINPITKNPIEQDIAGQKTVAPGGPPVGSTHNGYRFKGGNPNDKASWEKI